MKNWLRKIAVALFGFGRIANASDIPNFAETEQEAKQGNAASQFNLGLMYYLGKGATKDYKQAEHWFRRAAEQGDVEAQSNLGGLYYKGQGVAQDYEQAKYWFQKAAAQGFAKAQYDLGTIYFLVKALNKIMIKQLDGMKRQQNKGILMPNTI